MIVDVYHQDFPGDPDRLTLVARVQCPGATIPSHALEHAYRLTQNIEGSWSMGPQFPGGEANPDWSAQVERLAPLHEFEGRTLGLRSSMMGDVFAIGADRYRADTIGFKRVPA
jgi:hypothetical protein